MSSLRLLWSNNSRSPSCTVSLLMLLLQTSAWKEKKSDKTYSQVGRAGNSPTHSRALPWEETTEKHEQGGG